LSIPLLRLSRWILLLPGNLFSLVFCLELACCGYGFSDRSATLLLAQARASTAAFQEEIQSLQPTDACGNNPVEYVFFHFVPLAAVFGTVAHTACCFVMRHGPLHNPRSPRRLCRV
jgi:hypothetical protein